MAQTAVEAFQKREPDWRADWFQLFNQLSIHVMFGDSDDFGGDATLPEEMARVFAFIAMMFADHEDGSNNPLGLRKRLPNRPPDDLFKQMDRAKLAALAGAELIVGRIGGLTNDECFRNAARRMRGAGCSVSWTTMRSAWNNRHRLSDIPRYFLEDVIEAAEQLTPTPERLNELAKNAAKKNIQKTPASD